MLSAGDIKRGMVIRLDGRLMQVVQFEHQKIGRGGALLNLKLRDMDSGAMVDRSFTATKRYDRVRLETRQVQFVYRDAHGFHFMDTGSFEDLAISEEMLGDGTKFLVDGLELALLVEGDRPVSVELPPSVALKVVEAAPGHKGDTASSAYKPATVETGLTLQVPLFVEKGDTIRVDTRTGAYLERV